jgi:hypothetical protein
MHNKPKRLSLLLENNDKELIETTVDVRMRNNSNKLKKQQSSDESDTLMHQNSAGFS